MKTCHSANVPVAQTAFSPCRTVDITLNIKIFFMLSDHPGNQKPFFSALQKFLSSLIVIMSRRMGKPTICIGENKGAAQLRSNCEADQRRCFRHTVSTIPLLHISKVSSFELYAVTVQPSLCRTWNPNCWFSYAQAHI